MISPTGLCCCGCGQSTRIAECANSRTGDVKGEPRRFLKGHQTRRPSPPGRRLSTGGYVLLFAPEHPRATTNGSVFEHIVVAEKALGRLLPLGAVVHHVNDEKAENRNDNLVILENNSEHKSLHRRRRVLRAGGNPWTQWLCSTCKLPKDLTEFYRRKNGWVNSECKTCERKRRGTAAA